MRAQEVGQLIGAAVQIAIRDSVRSEHEGCRQRRLLHLTLEELMNAGVRVALGRIVPVESHMPAHFVVQQRHRGRRVAIDTIVSLDRVIGIHHAVLDSECSKLKVDSTTYWNDRAAGVRVWTAALRTNAIPYCEA